MDEVLGSFTTGAQFIGYKYYPTALAKNCGMLLMASKGNWERKDKSSQGKVTVINGDII